MCVCLFCKGCIDIYDGFSVGGQVSDGINISQNLILSSSGSGFSCSGINPKPTPTPSHKPSASEVFPNIVPDEYPDGGYWIIHNDYDNPIIIWFDIPVIDTNSESITYNEYIHIFKNPDINIQKDNAWGQNYDNENILLMNTITNSKYTKSQFLSRLKNSKIPISCTESDINCGNNGNIIGNKPNCYCNCSDNWEGTNCEKQEQPINSCDPNPCNNNGTCNDNICTCVNGWTGDTCNTPPHQPAKPEITNSVPNGILLNKNDKLQINLKGEDTQLISMGFWITHQYISECKACPNGVNRFEITMTYPCTRDDVDKGKCNKENGKINQLYFNQSYVDGFNSNVDVYVNLGDNCNIILNDDNIKCKFPLDNTCDNIGGISYINNNISIPETNKKGQKVCLSPKHSYYSVKDIKFNTDLDIFNKSRLGGDTRKGNPNVIQKLISVDEYDPVGCNTNAEKNVYSNENDKIFTGMCSCLNAWYSQPSSINPKLNEWASTVHNNCPSSYFFSYGEQIPNDFKNIKNNEIFKDQDWCYKIFDNQGKIDNLNAWATTSSVLTDYIPQGKSKPLFSKESDSLPGCGVPTGTIGNPNHDPKIYNPLNIIINVTDIYDHEE